MVICCSEIVTRTLPTQLRIHVLYWIRDCSCNTTHHTEISIIIFLCTYPSNFHGLWTIYIQELLLIVSPKKLNENTRVSHNRVYACKSLYFRQIHKQAVVTLFVMKCAMNGIVKRLGAFGIRT